MIRRLAFLTALALVPIPGVAAPSNQSTQSAIRAKLVQYLAARREIEHISAIAVSVSPRGGSSPDISVAAGTTSYGGSTPAQASELVQIGSNTKAYTAVLLLQLEAAGKLSVDDPLRKWLPQYPAWGGITIRQLLNMTSGIPTYDDNLRMQADWSRNPYRAYTAKQLIAYVYPEVKFAPGKRWMYSNTAYILSQLIVERVTGKTYADELRSRLFGPLGLTDTYYSDHIYSANVLARMPSGYWYNRGPGNEGLQSMLGRDMKAMSVSWAQGAGAIVASLPDINSWSRALFRGPLLAPKERAEMTSLVSLKTGQPVAGATTKDPRTFGLGVAQLHTARGPIWFYEGETLGYRTAFEYLPNKDVVVTISLNSQPDGKQDHIGKLFEAVEAILHQRGML